MKRTLVIAMAVLLLTVPMLAQEKIERRVIVKDGKVLMDTGNGPLPHDFHFDFALPGTWLGVSLVDLSPELREYFGVGREAGALVSSVAENSPAAKAGVKVGDIVVAVEGKNIESASDLRRGIREKKAGDAVRLDVIRKGARQSIMATVAEREMPNVPSPVQIEEITRRVNESINSPEWKARLERIGDCGDLQARIKDLEARLKDLEKRLTK